MNTGLIINPNIFIGKSEEEIIQICEKYLGEPTANFFPHALSTSIKLNTLAERISHIKRGELNKTENLSVEEIKRIEREFGPTGGITLTSTLAIKALNSEAEEIAKRGLKIGFNVDNIPKEEIERRFAILRDFCPKSVLEEYVKHILPRWYYRSSIQEIETDFKNRDIIPYLEKDLPQFLHFVEILQENNIDLNSLKMSENYSIADAYDIIQERFGKYMQNGKFVEPETNETTPEEVSNETENVQINTFEIDNENSMQSTPEEKTDRPTNEEIKQMIEENNRQMIQLIERNNQLIAMLTETHTLADSTNFHSQKL